MTLPSFILAFIIATLYGAIFHLWRGGNFNRLLLYLVLSWVGFFVGQFLFDQNEWHFLDLGPIHLGLNTIFCALILGLGYWLSPVKPEGMKKKEGQKISRKYLR